VSEPEGQEPTYGLVMPFLPVTSKGGPYDDGAYVAGFEMGRLDALLSAHVFARHEATVHTANQEQADLIAMKHGYRMELVTGQDGWVEVEFIATWERTFAVNGAEDGRLTVYAEDGTTELASGYPLLARQVDDLTAIVVGPPDRTVTMGDARQLADALDDDPENPHMLPGSRMWEKERADAAEARARQQRGPIDPPKPPNHHPRA